MFSFLVIGFTIGFLGSFHCIGMCGPIALSLPILNEIKSKRLLLISLYNIGRASSYAVMGALFGCIGNQFFLTGYQQVFSIGLGFLVLMFLFGGRYIQLESRLFKNLHQKVQVLLANKLHGEKHGKDFYLIGLVNGLLPCGLVYLAIASAAATGNAFQGGVLMFSFGAGTFPLMFSIMILGRAISFNARKQIKKMMPFFIGITACLLILRGMNLGIPFISPAFENINNKVVVSCHK